MKILVTGHRGYVGSVLTPVLQRLGHEVTGLDADWYSRCKLFDQDTEVQSWLRKDIRDAEVADFRGIEAVIHLAGLSNDPLGDLDPALTHEINAVAAIQLAKLAREAGVRRFLSTSSCSIYGAAGDQWINETARPAPVTAYAESKLSMEKGMRALARDDFELVFARPGTVFGVSPMLRFDLVMNNLVAWSLATNTIRFKSDGTAWRPLLHVEDLALALAFLVAAPSQQLGDQAFNIGFNQRNYRVRDLGPLIQSVLTEAQIEMGADGGADTRSYRVDCSRLAGHWSPAQGGVDFHAGIQQLVDCLQQNPVVVEDFEGARFQRVAHLREAMEKGRLGPDLRPLQRAHD